MSESLIRTELDGDLYIVRIHRPEKRNALTPAMLEELAAAVHRAPAEPGVRAVIVAGEGPIFSAGIDVMSLAQSRAEAGKVDPGRWLRRLATALQHALHTIEAVELPVLGALQGQVLGMGLELALSFDLRVASDDCKLSMPETRLGLIPDVGGTTRLCRTVGPSRAKDMIMTARVVEASEALEWGLVNRLVPEAELWDATVALAREIAANAPLAVGMSKLVIDQGSGLDQHAQMSLERWAQSQLIATSDVSEAMTAFFEKRPPRFQGK